MPRRTKSKRTKPKRAKNTKKAVATNVTKRAKSKSSALKELDRALSKARRKVSEGLEDFNRVAGRIRQAIESK